MTSCLWTVKRHEDRVLRRGQGEERLATGHRWAMERERGREREEKDGWEVGSRPLITPGRCTCVFVCLWLFPDKISDFLKMFLWKSEQRRDCKSTPSLSEPAYFTNKQPSLRTVLKAARRTKWAADNKLAIYQCQINMCVSCLDSVFFFFF